MAGIDGTISLYGPPGSGKSTVGRLLAEALGLPFYDLDAEIETTAGKPIPEIFQGEGEAGFRHRERINLEILLERGPAVIALGGGALLDDKNRARVEAAGPVVYLSAPNNVLLERLHSAGIYTEERPLLSGDLATRLTGLLEQRRAHYDSFRLRLNNAGLSPMDMTWEAQVALGRFFVQGMGAGYPVLVSRNGLEAVGAALLQLGLKGPVALVSDEKVAPLWAGPILDSLQEAGLHASLVTIPTGEANKTITTVGRLWEAFLNMGLERGSTVLALGGGVTGDLAGFAAATFLRGVRWATIPTSLLAMVDASLGGKTGCDLPQGKNLVGAFHPPSLVLADPQVLDTLPPEELRSGLAEVVKHGVIGDPILFNLCEELQLGIDGVPAHMSLNGGTDQDEIVRRAMAVKVRVIRADPYERGPRAALNLGHTLGHAAEAVSGYRLLHGEAVSIGMVAAARLSERMGLAETGLTARITFVLEGLGLPTRLPAGLDKEGLIHAMRLDKKRAGGLVRFVLPIRIGEVRVGVEVEDLQEVIIDL